MAVNIFNAFSWIKQCYLIFCVSHRRITSHFESESHVHVYRPETGKTISLLLITVVSFYKWIYLIFGFQERQTEFKNSYSIFGQGLYTLMTTKISCLFFHLDCRYLPIYAGRLTWTHLSIIIHRLLVSQGRGLSHLPWPISAVRSGTLLSLSRS